MVTGKAERQSLHLLFRALQARGRCSFQVIRQIGQRSPITSRRRQLSMVGTGKTIPDRDEEEIGLPARGYLSKGSTFVLLVDDLEFDRAKYRRLIFERYRNALDTILVTQELKKRSSVHFLVNMLEAYYFGDAKAVNVVLGTNLEDYSGDVEEIRNPKNDLTRLCPGFRDVRDGGKILEHLDLGHVLQHPDTCGSLRALIAWCSRAVGLAPTDWCRLDSGIYSILSGCQIAGL
jgi:hypothetical protein